MKFNNLSDMELDALREISSVGAGHASTALSSLTDKRVEITFPGMSICPLEGVTSCIDNPESEVANVYLHIDGASFRKQFEVCSLLMTFPVKSAMCLARILQGEQDLGGEFSEMDKSTLMEVGNILGGSYLSAIADFMKFELIESLPYIASDMLESVMDPIIARHACEVEDALVFNTKFLVDGNELSGHFVVLFYSPMRTLLKNVRYLGEIENGKKD